MLSAIGDGSAMYEFVSETKTETETKTERRTDAGDPTKPTRVVSQVSRSELAQQGRRRSLYRSFGVFVALLLLQQPLRFVATGYWESAMPDRISAEVPARLSLMVDVAMVAAYVMVGFRALQLVWAYRPGTIVRVVSYAAAVLLFAGGVADLVENAILWRRVGGVTTETVDLALAWSNVMRGSVLIGLVAMGVLAAIGVRRYKKSPPHVPSGLQDEESRPRQAICCSGGGMRSASFCLGGLQELTARGIYKESDLVIGVSGGGYIAAGYHSVRWRSGVSNELWQPLDPPAFSPSSPELHWLRRNSRYLLDSTQSALQGLMSLLFGIAVNLVLVTAVVGAAAWLLGWYLAESRGLRGWRTAYATSLDFRSDWTWVPAVAAIPLAAGALLFVVEKVVGKFASVNYKAMGRVRQLETPLVTVGIVLVGLLLGVPTLLELIHDYAATSGSAVAQLLHALGFVPDSVCENRINVGRAACGVSVDDIRAGEASGAPGTADGAALLAGGFGAVLAAILAVVRSAGSLLEQDDKPTAGKSGLAGLGAKVWPFLKTRVLPWLAAVVILLVVVTLLLRWTAALVVTPDRLASWHLAYWFGGIIVGIRLLTDATRTSLHHYYRERLSFAFLVRRQSGTVGPFPYGEPVRFSQSKPTEGAGPRFVSCAVANVNAPGIVPVGRGCIPFAFDDKAIGLTDPRLPSGEALIPSSLYEYAADRRFRDATIPGAIAMSGAAFSPLAGRENARLSPYRMVLALANARLGVWLPNPLWVDELTTTRRLVKSRNVDEARTAVRQLTDEQFTDLRSLHLKGADLRWFDGFRRSGNGTPTEETGTWVRTRVRAYQIGNAVLSAQSKPGPFRLLKEAVGSTSLLDRKVYVTDGGHYDNLGLVEALRRKARIIYVLDASADPEDTFRTLGRAIATARMDLDCEVEFDPRSMRRLKAERSAAAFGVGRYRYPDGAEGEIRMVKVVMVDGLPWDVETYSGQNARFPLTSTGDQLYGEFDLEAYRILGREVTRTLLAHCVRAGSRDGTDPLHPERAGDRDDGGEQVQGGVAAAEGE